MNTSETGPPTSLCCSRRWKAFGMSRSPTIGKPSITPRFSKTCRTSSSRAPGKSLWFRTISTPTSRPRPTKPSRPPKPGGLWDFRKDNGPAIRKVCVQFVELCRRLGLLTKASVAIDGSKFKAVNNRDKNFTSGKVERRRKQLEESVARYLSQLDTADRQEPSEALAAKTAHLKEKIAKIGEEAQGHGTNALAREFAAVRRA